MSPDNGAQPRVVFADDGAVLREVTPEMGRDAVAAFVRRSAAALLGGAIRYDGAVQTDQAYLWIATHHAANPLVHDGRAR